MEKPKHIQGLAIATLYIMTTGVFSLINRMVGMIQGGKGIFMGISYFMRNYGVWFLFLVILTVIFLTILQNATRRTGLLSLFLKPLVLFTSGILIAAEAVLEIGFIVSRVVTMLFNLNEIPNGYIFKTITTYIPSFVITILQLLAGVGLLYLHKTIRVSYSKQEL